MKVKNTEQYVLDVLKGNIKAREYDFILYGAVLKRLGYDLKNTNLHDFLASAKRNNTPSFETVTRCRRKLCEQMPELLGGEVARYREFKKQEILEYAREKNLKYR